MLTFVKFVPYRAAKLTTSLGLTKVAIIQLIEEISNIMTKKEYTVGALINVKNIVDSTSRVDHSVCEKRYDIKERAHA